MRTTTTTTTTTTLPIEEESLLPGQGVEPKRSNPATAQQPQQQLNLETTPSFQALQYWAHRDPDRTALIFTRHLWKVRKGRLLEEHASKKEWRSWTYRELYHRVDGLQRVLRQQLLHRISGNKQPTTTTKTTIRVVLLYLPPNRAELIAWLIALQAAGCVLLFGTPEAFNGLRSWAQAMLDLQPDVILGSRTLLTVFRTITMTLRHKKGNNKRHLQWIPVSSILKQVALTQQQGKHNPKEDLNTNNNHQHTSINLDQVTTVMFSGGTTGSPTPIDITHRMMCFQAAGYAKLLQQHLEYNILNNMPANISAAVQQNDDDKANSPNTTPTSSSDNSSVATADQSTTTNINKYGLLFNNNNNNNNKSYKYISTHVFLNFVLLDLACGGTACLQPMGVSCPDETVCIQTLQQLFEDFQTQITSAPPALWQRLLVLNNNKPCPTSSSSLKLAFVGGAETSTRFVRGVMTKVLSHHHIHSQENSQEDSNTRRQDDNPGQDTQQQTLTTTNTNNNNHNNEDEECCFYRVYGATQVLPMALASARSILAEEDQFSLCSRGGGVYFGHAVEGLEFNIDPVAWQAQGGKVQLTVPLSNTKDTAVEVGELCVYGTAVSPSMDIVVRKDTTMTADGDNTSSVVVVPSRIFRTGDACYIHPVTKSVYFLGRMAQAVDCGPVVQRVPPVGIEMICLETQAVDRCAFVGISRKRKRNPPPDVVDGDNDTFLPVIIVQSSAQGKDDMTTTRATLREALAKSIWSDLLQTGICLAVYPRNKKHWPVDVRHSSKINRNLLRDWASRKYAKQPSNFHPL